MPILFRRILFSLLVFCVPAFAQVATGTYPYGSFDSKGFDTINRGNLNTHFSIPIINKPGRGLPFYYNLSYDSSVWYPAIVSGVTTWTSVPNFGWRGDSEIATGYVSFKTSINQVVISQGPGKPSMVCRNVINSNFAYHDPFGVQHGFAGRTVQGAPSQCGDFSIPSINGFTSINTDGSGYTMKVVGMAGASITTASGQTFTPPLSPNRASGIVTDSNGNQISTDNQGHFTDTLGKQILTVAGGSPNPETFTYTDTNGNPQTVQISYRSYTVQTNFGCSGIVEANTPNTYLVDAVILPDSSAYHFQYEVTPGYSGSVTGRLASVALPTGGTISYSYGGGNNGIVCTDGSAAGLTRSISSDSGSAASTWTYTRTIPTSNASQTDIGDGNGNHSVYDFILAGTSAYYEANHVVYQGAAGGTVLASMETCYNGVTPDCTTSVPTLPISQIDTYREKNNGPQRGSTIKLNQYGLETEKDDWDYGTPSARGTSLLRKEVWVYPTSGIVSLVSWDDVYDGAGNLASATGYGYDETTPTPISAIPQHIAVTGPRGNLTTISQWLKTGSFITTTNIYEDTGTLLSSHGPNGTTTYAYDPTASYATGETLPTPSSGIALSSAATYDMNTGVLLTSADLNGEVTTAKSYDSELRPTEVDFPDGGKEIVSYSPTQTVITQTMNSNTSAITYTLYDGYGRKSRVAVANGQTNPYYQTDYCYDGAGRLQFQSMVYQGTGWDAAKQCSGSGTIYSYDALNRPTTISNADGTNSYLYTDRAVKVTDVNGVQRITQSDALGRTTAICEISSNASMPGSGAPSSCGMDIGGTGFLTSYAYDLANHKTTITQGAQQRVFQTDPLGRTVLTTEPERGTTTYSYAYNSTGLVVTRQRPRANQTNATVLTTTTTQYDSLGRAVSVNYDDQLTPTKEYLYDASAQWLNFTQTNLKGRLSVALISNPPPAAITAGTSYTYDAMGRVTMSAVCLPFGCGNGAKDLHLPYTYDLLGNMLSAGDGFGTTTSYTYSPANEITSISSSLSDATHPSSLVSNVQNGPFGPSTYSLGNRLQVFRAYDSAGRPQGEWVCRSTPSMGCGGSANQVHGVSVGWSGTRPVASEDTNSDVPGNNLVVDFGYDEFNRLTSRTNQNTGQQMSSYVYDRYGNRWQQNTSQGGPAPQFSFNSANNQIVGDGYDAAGNLTSDGFHAYKYDAEGNLIQVDGGQTATYVFDALNQWVQSTYPVNNGQVLYTVYNKNGQWVSLLDSTGSPVTSKHYWGSLPVAFDFSDGKTHFEHQDWVGTERMRTSYNGSVEGYYTSLPFGDALSLNISDQDQYHFGQLNYETWSNTDHAQFRQYSHTQGRWMSPDPYNGSYDLSNPQSMNRYSYVLNNPLAGVDPFGLSPICAYCKDPEEPADGTGPCEFDACVTAAPLGPVDPDDPSWCFFGDCGTSTGSPSGPNHGPGLGTGGSGGGGGTGTAPNNPVVVQNPCAVQGRALPPSAYVMQGKQSGASAIDFSLDAAMGWPKNRYLDAQPLASGNVFQKQAYGNYVFGAYMAAAGVPLNVALSGASGLALVSGAYFTYTRNGFQMDQNYPLLPAANVGNITNGYNAAANGTVCHN